MAAPLLEVVWPRTCLLPGEVKIMRTVGEYCNRSVIIGRPEQSLKEAARSMREHHVGCVVVIEPGASGNRPVGIVTDRDIVVRVLAQTDLHLEQVRLDDIMARPVVTIGESDELVDALEAMRSAGVRRLPVVDERNSVIGLLSFDDLIRHFQGSFGDFAALLLREQQQEQRSLARGAAR
jgi:CBS domain-containing protein